MCSFLFDERLGLGSSASLSRHDENTAHDLELASMLHTQAYRHTCIYVLSLS